MTEVSLNAEQQIRREAIVQASHRLGPRDRTERARHDISELLNAAQRIEKFISSGATEAASP